MGLRALLALDAVVFTDSDAWGETVGYRPKTGGGPNTIPAIVFREEPDSGPESSRFRQRRVEVFIANNGDVTKGVAQPDEDGDKLDVILRVGESATLARVTSVINGDEGGWLLEVRE